MSLFPDLIPKQLLPYLTFLLDPLMNPADKHVISMRAALYFICVTPWIMRCIIILSTTEKRKQC